jgi:hypothetical protein
MGLTVVIMPLPSDTHLATNATSTRCLSTSSRGRGITPRLRAGSQALTRRKPNNGELGVIVGVWTYLQSEKEFPVADFDLRFFLKVVLDICSDPETLRKVLAGEDLRCWHDDSETSCSSP